jgi:hypothetical protein
MMDNDLEKCFQTLPILEKLLEAYDPHFKKENDIFFTPQPMVSFILRSIHSILVPCLINSAADFGKVKGYGAFE